MLVSVGKHAESKILDALQAVSELTKTERTLIGKRREEIKFMEEAIRKVMREELKRSPRKEALDLALEKNEVVDDVVEVKLVESSFNDLITGEIMRIVRKLAPEILKTKSIENIVTEIDKVITDRARSLYIDFVETCGNFPIHASRSRFSVSRYAQIQINYTGFLQIHCYD